MADKNNDIGALTASYLQVLLGFTEHLGGSDWHYFKYNHTLSTQQSRTLYFYDSRPYV